MGIAVTIGFIALMAFCLGVVIFDRELREWVAKNEIEQMTNANWRALGEERLTLQLNTAIYDRDRKASTSFWGRAKQQSEVIDLTAKLNAYKAAREKVENKLREEKRERLLKVCQDLFDMGQGTFDSGTNSRWYGLPITMRDAFKHHKDDHMDLERFNEFRYVVGHDVTGHTIEFRNSTTGLEGSISWQEFAWLIKVFGDALETDDITLAKALEGQD